MSLTSRHHEQHSFGGGAIHMAIHLARLMHHTIRGLVTKHCKMQESGMTRLAPALRYNRKTGMKSTFSDTIMSATEHLVHLPKMPWIPCTAADTAPTTLLDTSLGQTMIHSSVPRTKRLRSIAFGHQCGSCSLMKPSLSGIYIYLLLMPFPVPLMPRTMKSHQSFIKSSTSSSARVVNSKRATFPVSNVNFAHWYITLYSTTPHWPTILDIQWCLDFSLWNKKKLC